MHKPLIQRLFSLSMAVFVTLVMLGSVGQLFVGAEAQHASLAQHTVPAAPRA